MAVSTSTKRWLILAWMVATACTRWTPYVSTQATDANHPLGIARVTLRNGTSGTLYKVTVRADSVIGFNYRDSLVAYSSEQVKGIQRAEFSGDETFVLALILISALLYAAYLISGQG